MKINILFFVLVLFTQNLFSQGAKGTYIWPEYAKSDIPEAFETLPAFYINNVRTIDFTDGNGSQMVVFKRIYINSETAAEEHNKMELYIDNEGFISVLAARTIKHDGSIIELSNDQIIETYSQKKNKYGDEIVRRAQFLFPSVSVGDVLDIAYQIDYNHYLYSKLMYMEDDLPSMESRISLRNSSLLQLAIYPLNDMSPMDRSPINGIPSVSWKQKNVEALRIDYFNALPPDHPCFSYMLWRSNEVFDYKKIYEVDEGNFPSNFNTSRSITKHFISNGIIGEEDNIVTQVQKIVKHFEAHFDWNRSENTQYTSQSFDFLKRKKIDYTLFYRYITKFLTERKVSYEKGYTKNLLDGKFELDVISLEQIDDRFLLFNDENSTPHFLFPPLRSGHFYYVDETPFYCEGNQAICLSGKKGSLDEQFGIKIPDSKSNINRHRAYVSLHTIPEMPNSCLVERKDVLGGHYSYLARSSSGKTWLKELNIISGDDDLKPTSMDEGYPYKVNFMQTSDTLELLSNISDSLYWLDLSSMLPEGIFTSNEVTFPRGNYMVLPFKKENQISFYLNHEGTIKLAEDDARLTFSNPVGNLSAEIKQMSANSLMIEINLQIKNRLLKSSEEINYLYELFEDYSTIRQKKWTLSLS